MPLMRGMMCGMLFDCGYLDVQSRREVEQKKQACQPLSNYGIGITRERLNDGGGASRDPISSREPEGFG